MATDLKRSKKKHGSGRLRWKLFAAILIPAIILLVILWIIQTVFLGVFYGSIKTNELKRATDTVINHLESDDIKDRILTLSNDMDINIRVVETEQFNTLYTTGEAFNSVMHGWQTYGMFNLYNEVVENGGELVRYYSENEQVKNNKNAKDVPEPPEFSPGEPMNSEELEHFRERYKPIPRPNLFDNIGKHNDILYAKNVTLSDGTEIMVVADTRISPLDSTVKTLRHQLVICSAVTVILSLIVSYFISRHISKPIEKINKSAKVLASGDYDVKFDGKGYREIEELNDTLNYTSSELKKVEGLRRELVSNVSHDMRTPLTMIIGYAEAMRDLPGENTPENVQVIIDEAKRLSEFVNNVLDLSKLEEGMQEITPCRTEITAVLKTTCERYKKLVPEAGLELCLEGGEPIFVMCDESKTVQALNNLIDNAVNYAKKPKKVVVNCKTVGTKVRIEVSDNGDGINPAELPYIWDRYYKTEKSHKRNIVGSGIGLSIVKKILLLHGARFGVETKQNEGSTFWFELEKE